MEVVWEAHVAGSSSRKRASKACDQCQRRKKRCHHTTEGLSSHQSRKFSSGTEAVPQKNDDQDTNPSAERSPEPLRAGDFHPESILTDLSTGSTDGVLERLAQKSAGLGSYSEELSPSDARVAPSPGINRRAKRWEREMLKKRRRPLSERQRRYLEEAGAFRVLPRATQDALLSTYIACLDGLLPIVDGGKVLRDHYSGQASQLLIQAICLVACKTEQATPYLRISPNGPLLEPLAFARTLYDGLNAAVLAELEHDRFTNIQILALMHLHNDGQDGFAKASAHLSQAIHEAWVLNMHFYLPGRTALEQSTLLWWTLWSLDRINALLQASPLMIADRDIDLQRPPVDSEYKHQIMAISLKLGDILDDVIEVYRPTSDPNLIGWEENFPSWSDVCAGVNLDALQISHREIWYHVAAILSCRSSGPGTKSYRRRLESADLVQELTSGGRHLNLPPLPIIPYAVSLSLTSAYRAIRDSQKPPDIAYKDLVTRCETLESLSRRWWSAGKMAKLGRKALSSLKASSSVTECVSDAGAGRHVRFVDSHQNVLPRSSRDRNGATITRSETGGMPQPGDNGIGNAVGFQRNATYDGTNIASSHESRAQGENGSFSFQSDAVNPTNSYQLTDLDNIFGDLFDFGLPAMNQDTVFWGISPSSLGYDDVAYGAGTSVSDGV